MSCGRDLGDGELSKQLLDQTINQISLVRIVFIYLFLKNGRLDFW